VGEIPNFPAGRVPEINTSFSREAVVPNLLFISEGVIPPELNRSVSVVVYGLWGISQRGEKREIRAQS